MANYKSLQQNELRLAQGRFGSGHPKMTPPASRGRAHKSGRGFGKIAITRLFNVCYTNGPRTKNPGKPGPFCARGLTPGLAAGTTPLIPPHFRGIFLPAIPIHRLTD
jgi:hypothetical protein